MYNRCELEIDAIRLKHYEETKHLSIEERVKRVNDRGQKLSAEFGFTIVPSAINRSKEQDKYGQTD